MEKSSEIPSRTGKGSGAGAAKAKGTNGDDFYSDLDDIEDISLPSNDDHTASDVPHQPPGDIPAGPSSPTYAVQQLTNYDENHLQSTETRGVAPPLPNAQGDTTDSVGQEERQLLAAPTNQPLQHKHRSNPARKSRRPPPTQLIQSQEPSGTASAGGCSDPSTGDGTDDDDYDWRSTRQRRQAGKGSRILAGGVDMKKQGPRATGQPSHRSGARFSGEGTRHGGLRVPGNPAQGLEAAVQAMNNKGNLMGVRKKSDRYEAIVFKDGIQQALEGSHLTAEAAARARDQYYRERDPPGRRGPPIRYNFPRPGELGRK